MTTSSGIEKRTVARVKRRIIPILIVIYFVAYLDRSNISFGKLQMSSDLGLSSTAFGLASGLFFIGYVIVELPSNLAMHRFGARKWMARIMISWGILAVLTAFVPNVPSLYVLRFLLGIAEAGLYPGILLYLTYWLPKRHRATATALFLLAIPIAAVIGSPLSAWLMTALNSSGFEGWRAMFLVEGIPSILLAFVLWFVLSDHPENAKWLRDDERAWLTETLRLEAERAPQRHLSLRRAIVNPHIMLLSAIYFGLVFGQYALTFFLPTIIDGIGTTFHHTFSILEIGYLTAIPYACAAIAMYLIGRNSDRTGERKWHVIIPVVISAVATPIALYLGSPVLEMVAIAIATAGLYGAYPSFWQLPNAVLTGTAAAAGLALVNSIGNIAGFAAPYITGALSDATGGSYKAPMWVMGAVLLASGLLVLAVARTARRGAATPSPSLNQVKENQV